MVRSEQSELMHPGSVVAEKYCVRLKGQIMQIMQNSLFSALVNTLVNISFKNYFNIQ